MSVIDRVKSAWNGWNNPVVNTPLSLTDLRLPQSIKFFYHNGQLQWENANGADAIKRIYEICAPISSVIDNMADAFVNAEFQALNSRTENKVRGVNKDWQKLIENPNWFQDGNQFFKQLYTYRKMWGYCYVLKIKSIGFTVPDLICLPPWLLEIEYEQGRGYMPKDNRKVYLCIDGTRELIDKEDLMLFTDVCNVFDETVWLPRPRIFTKQYPLSLIISILEAQTALIQNKGALGIVSSADRIEGMGVPMSEDQKNDLQRQWHNKYGMTRDKAQMIFTRGAVTYTPLVFDFEQLQLNPTYLSAYKDVSDALHYPIELTAHSDRSTYNNVLLAETSLYQNAILPDANSIMKSLTKQLKAENVTFYADYNHVDALQRGKKDKAEARRALNQALVVEWNNGLITRNRWAELLEEETRPNDELWNKTKFELTPEEMGIIQQRNGTQV